MNLQAEKLEVVRMILDTDDKVIINNLKSILKNHQRAIKKTLELGDFYEGFKNGVHEVKQSVDGEIELKDANTWLNGLKVKSNT